MAHTTHAKHFPAKMHATKSDVKWCKFALCKWDTHERDNKNRTESERMGRWMNNEETSEWNLQQWQDERALESENDEDLQHKWMTIAV